MIVTPPLGLVVYSKPYSSVPVGFITESVDSSGCLVGSAFCSAINVIQFTEAFFVSSLMLA